MTSEFIKEHERRARMRHAEICRAGEPAVLAAPDRSKRDAETRLEHWRVGRKRRDEPMIVDNVRQLDARDEIRIVGECKQLVQHEIMPSIERHDDGAFRRGLADVRIRGSQAATSRACSIFLSMSASMMAPS